MPGDGLAGVDEAGKGPVLGSMFAAAVRVPDPTVLPEGIDDSKRLSPDRRESLARELSEHPEIAVGVHEVPVGRIDDPGTDMNRLTVAAHASAVGQVVSAGDRVLADACDTSEARFADRLGRRLGAHAAVDAQHGANAAADAQHGANPAADAQHGADVTVDAQHGADVTVDAQHGADVTVDAQHGADAAVDAQHGADVTVDAQHGADETHAVVAAASVVAKVRRDAHVAGLADRHGEIGSGYPSDPTTREFLEEYVDEHGAVPSCARESWSTCRDLLADREQAGLGEF